MRKYIAVFGLLFVFLFATGAVKWSRSAHMRTGTATVTSTLDVTGAATFASTVAVTGGLTQSGDITLENAEIISNSTDSIVEIEYDDDAVALGELSLYSSNTATEINNTVAISVSIENVASVKTKISQIMTQADDISTSSMDATLLFGVITAGSLANELAIDGADVYPVTDGGLNLGKSGNEFGELHIQDAFTRDEVILTQTAVEITSPSLVAAVGGAGYVILTSDESITGASLSGGAINQVVILRTGAGSETIRFDDSGGMHLGANVTVTEGQNDVLAFVCINADGLQWAAMYAHDN